MTLTKWHIVAATSIAVACGVALADYHAPQVHTWLSPELFTAIGTWALALITIALVYDQHREGKRATGLQLFAQLTQEFQNPNMRNLRRLFAAALLWERRKLGTNDPLSDETVLEFFERLAHLTRSKVLDKTIVWNYFAYAVEGYWYATKDHVAHLRDGPGDEDLYCDLEWLSDEFKKLEAKRRNASSQIEPTQTKIDTYLESESKLQ